MNLKEISKLPEKHNEGYEALDTAAGMEAAAEKSYNNLIKVEQHISTLRKIIGMMAVITTISVGGFVYKSSTNPYVPYVVRISDTGTINGQKLTSDAVTLDDNTIQFFLVDFIKKTRTIYKDKQYYNQQVADKMSFLTAESKAKLENLFATKTATKEIVSQGYTTSVSIDSFLKVEGNKKFQINYTENILSSGGTLIKQEKYSAILTLGKTEVTNDAMIRMNPLGILITDIDLSLVSSTSSALPQQQQNPAQQLQPNNLNNQQVPGQNGQ